MYVRVCLHSIYLKVAEKQMKLIDRIVASLKVSGKGSPEEVRRMQKGKVRVEISLYIQRERERAEIYIKVELY